MGVAPGPERKLGTEGGGEADCARADSSEKESASMKEALFGYDASPGWSAL